MSDPRLDRRSFLGSAAAAPLLPWSEMALGPIRPGVGSRALIVLELDGGNDGLNTLLPIEDPVWRDRRPKMATVRRGAHDLGDGFALHPELRALHRWMRDGHGAAIHAVGYRGASRSHFLNRDIWHTGDVRFDELRAHTTGWLGRAADRIARTGVDVPALSVGSVKVPLALKARDIVVPSIRRIEDYQLLVAAAEGNRQRRRGEVKKIVTDAQGGDDLRAYLGSVAKSAVDNAEKLRGSLASYRAQATYPKTDLGRKLQLLSRVLLSGFGSRIFHVNFAGFDTHANQLPTHAGLLRQLSTALAALLSDLQGHRRLEDVLVVVCSEFGRRVAENRSRGTDHGKAGPVFLFGGGVRGGLHGKAPSLADLDGGDLKFTTDFRQVYATALRWLGVAPKEVLGAEFAGLEVLTKR